MIQISSPEELQSWCLEKRASGLSIGFVPTMGALHEGHAALVQRSTSENDVTIVSIFVNPTQFDNPEDLEKYPTTLTNDSNLLKSLGVHVLFTPNAEAMYPTGSDLFVEETFLSQDLCGAHRPGHFRGVLTVVLKLFMLSQPHRAYFGEKDFQQLLLVKKLAESFFLPIEIRSVPTIRDNFGIALSSRNRRLDPEALPLLAQFPKILSSANSDSEAASILESLGFDIDYVTTRNQMRHGAVYLNGVRFIDHVEV